MKHHSCIIIIAALLSFSACATTAENSVQPEDSLANLDPFATSSIYARFEKSFSTTDLVRKEIKVYLHPRINSVSIDFENGANKNQLFLNTISREKCVAALDKFVAEFDAKTLNKNTKSSFPSYGATSAEHKWGVLRIAAEASPEIRFGYQFAGENPYFTIFIPGMPNRLYSSSSVTKVQFSVDQRVYFSKTEAIALRQALEQKYLLKKLKEQDPAFGNESADKY